MVLTTTATQVEAEQLARALVERQLAACVQMLPINSVYAWQGAVQQGAEVLMLIKTSRALFASMAEFIASQHSYSVPEIIQLPITQLSAGYLQWMSSVLSSVPSGNT